MALKQVSYIIVTWNNADIITDCIDSLLRFCKAENQIIVVDNNSKDTTCSVIKEKYGESVLLIEAGENLGFSKANNLGLTKATGDYIFFINPDVVFIEDIVSPMLRVLDSCSDVGIVSPMLIYPDGRYQVSTCNFPSAKKVFWDDLHFYKLLPVNKRLKLAQAQCRCGGDRYVDWSYGAAHLCRADDVRSVGGYPHGYFMYGEDTEFCMYFLHKLGLKNYYLGSSKLIHLGGYSEKQVVNSKKIIYGTNAAMYFVNKYFGKASLARYRIILAFASLAKYLAACLKCLLRNTQENRNSKVKWGASFMTVLHYRGEQN